MIFGKGVSILVLVEFRLGELFQEVYQYSISSFNPCSGGISSGGSFCDMANLPMQLVSILVLVEFRLGVGISFTESQMEMSFNPCSGGISSGGLSPPDPFL